MTGYLTALDALELTVMNLEIEIGLHLDAIAERDAILDKHLPKWREL